MPRYDDDILAAMAGEPGVPPEDILDPQEFGFPGPASTVQPQAFTLPPPTPAWQKALKGVGTVLEPLARPGKAVSELVQGGDWARALLTGRTTKPTLGRRAFADQPGFGVEDIGAFAVDVLADPLTWIGPGLAKSGLRLLGTASKASPKLFFADLVAEAEEAGVRAAARRGGARLPEHLVKAKRLEKMFKPLDTGGLGVTREWFQDEVRQILGSERARGILRPKDVPAEMMDDLLAGLKRVTYNNTPPSQGLFGSLQRTVGLNLLPVVSALRRTGSPWGQRLAAGLEEMGERSIINPGRLIVETEAELKRLNLLKKGRPTESVLEASTLLAESGGSNKRLAELIFQHGEVGEDTLKALTDPRAVQLSQRWRRILDFRREQLSLFRDKRGSPFQVLTEEGAVPFEKAVQADYVPHMFDWEKLKPGSERWGTFVGNFRRQNKLRSVEEAEDLLNLIVKRRPKKVGQIEYARLQNVGGYELNPLEWLPRYLYQTEQRMAFADHFGVDGRDAMRLLGALEKSGHVPRQWADDLRGIMFNRVKGNYEVSDLVRRITDFQVISKMGLGSTISNISQNANTAVLFGATRFARAVRQSFTEEGQKLGALAYSRQIRNDLQRLVGGAEDTIGTKYLNAVGFNFAEKWNRFFSANAGTIALQDWARQYAATRSPRVAQQLSGLLGVTDDELRFIAGGGGPTRDMVDRAAFRASRITQHATSWEQLPKLWQNQYARVALQYKNFAYNQTRFMFEQIFAPAFQYTKTSGAAGDIMPLVRFAPIFTTSGAAVSHLRDLVKAPARKLLTDKWQGKEHEWFWESDDWLAAAARDSLMVGSLGILGDMWQGAERGTLPQWLAGPTITDIGELTSRGVKTTKGLYNRGEATREMEAFTNWLMHRAIPGVSPMIPSDVKVGR